MTMSSKRQKNKKTNQNMTKTLMQMRGDSHFLKQTDNPGLRVMVTRLSKYQKTAVREIEFGSLLSLHLIKLPKSLALYFIHKFHIQNTSLTLKHDTINIDEDNVNLVLGFPRGTKAADESSKDIVETEQNKAFIAEMKKYSNFPLEISSIKRDSFKVQRGETTSRESFSSTTSLV